MYVDLYMNYPPIIGCVSNKGGCGKTTSLCNLFERLSVSGLKTLLVDKDVSSASATQLLARCTNNLTSEQQKYSGMEYIMGPITKYSGPESWISTFME